MPEQPIVNIDTGKELSPETKEMLEGTPEDDVLTDGESPAQPGSGLRIPVPNIPVPEQRDD